MAEHEKKPLKEAAAEGSALASVLDEGTVLAITASYLAGKEAGLREAKAENQPG